MSYDVGGMTESLENELCSFSKFSVTSPTSQLVLQPFRRFTYVAAHSPTLPSLYLRRSSFSNLSVTSPKSQLILQHFRRFTYVAAHSRTLPFLHLRHSSFSNHSFTSLTSHALDLRHLASRPCNRHRDLRTKGNKLIGSSLRFIRHFCLCLLFSLIFKILIYFHSPDHGRLAR